MLIILAFSIFAAAFYEFVCPGKASLFAAPLHQACLSLSKHNQLSSYTQAAICGSPEALRRLYAENSGTNLTHFFIFSSLHILAIEACCRVIHTKSRLISFSFIAAFFALLGGPIRLTRILLQLLLQDGTRKWQLRWTPTQVLTVSCLISSLCIRSRADALALALGWIGALAFLIKTPGPPARWKSAVKIYLLLIPGLLPLTLPHPLSLLATIFLGPLFLILWPLGLLEMALARPLGLDRAIAVTSSALSSALPPAFSPVAVPEAWLGAYILLLTQIARTAEVAPDE